jgi:hypothetical protein
VRVDGVSPRYEDEGHGARRLLRVPLKLGA